MILRTRTWREMTAVGVLWFLSAGTVLAQPKGFVPCIERSIVSPQALAPGDEVQITVYWKNVGSEPAPAEYHIFMHIRPLVRTANWHGIVRNCDHRPKTPTTRWTPGKLVKDGPKRWRIPANAPLGEYVIEVGVLNKKGGRIPLANANAVGKSTGGGPRHVIGRLRVIDPRCRVSQTTT